MVFCTKVKVKINPVIYGFNKDREGIEQLGSVISVGCLIYKLFVLNSAQSSGNNWKFHKFLSVKNYLKESLLPIFCLIIQVKGLMLNTGGNFI